ncbi:MAG TPA: DegT/DnrJ/EryC1/StrS family aminotransferase [Pyrinomonadaceae bacterium]|nr:DegT/DnrJ/EryC1/StrS family aminotransferase [Pyrinomonadaceae bacterium]
MKIPLLDLKAQYATIREDVRTAVDRVLESQRFVLGNEGETLEAEIARYCQTKFAIACASGSDALLLALMSCEVAAGDEVITTPFTFFATAAAVTRLGARPRFVDIDERTFNLDVARIAEAISPRTRAIIAVHLYGQCVDMEPLIELAARHGISIVEDAAQAIGAEDRGRRAGSMGAIGALSFYPSKNLGGAGDGGMLVTNDENHARRLRMLHVHGEQQKYHHDAVGINSRLDEIQAAILHVKLSHLDAWTHARQERARRYGQLFTDAGLAEQITTPQVRDDARHVFHQYVVRVPASARDSLREHLRAREIGNDVYYPAPLHLQKCFFDLGHGAGDFPAAETAAAETIALPIYPELSELQQEYIVNAFADFFA